MLIPGGWKNLGLGKQYREAQLVRTKKKCKRRERESMMLRLGGEKGKIIEQD